MQALSIRAKFALLLLRGQSIGPYAFHRGREIAIITCVESGERNIGPLSDANEANGFIRDKYFGLKLIFRNDLQHRLVAAAFGDHIAAADVELKHQPCDRRFDIDAREQHIGLSNVFVQNRDLIEVAFYFLAQARLTAALVGFAA